MTTQRPSEPSSGLVQITTTAPAQTKTTKAKPDHAVMKLQILELAVEASRGQNWTSSAILKLASDMWDFMQEA